MQMCVCVGGGGGVCAGVGGGGGKQSALWSMWKWWIEVSTRQILITDVSVSLCHFCKKYLILRGRVQAKSKVTSSSEEK